MNINKIPVPLTYSSELSDLHDFTSIECTLFYRSMYSN